MPDIEKVKKIMVFVRDQMCHKTDCRECEYNNPDGYCYSLSEIMRDALSVIDGLEAEIKKCRQTPMKPGLAMDSTGIYSTCPRCGKKLNEIVSARGYNREGKYPEYCEDCGLKIDWGLDR